jgi:hypothetical protein
MTKVIGTTLHFMDHDTTYKDFANIHSTYVHMR